MSYEEIGRMTPDQVYHKLCDRDVLKAKRGRRVSDVNPTVMEPDSDGFLRGRDADGNQIKAKIRVGGKSLARRLMEEAERKIEQEHRRGN